MTKHQRKPQDYTFTGAFDRTKFHAEYTKEFKTVPKFNSASIPDLMFVLGKLEQDPNISDIRWMAYMLATTFIETSHTMKVKHEVKRRHRSPIVRTSKVWRNFTPVEEAGHGRGRDYYLPVKVKKLPNGCVQVTEYDGDQWTVSAGGGRPMPVHPDQDRGVPSGFLASPVYDRGGGEEHQYFGRGYVQLTWWSNYASAGAIVGKGLDLLLDPDSVMEPEMAYLIMATGMRTGQCFANGHKLSQFFHGSHTDYATARLMVNPKAKHENKLEVAHVAEHFETVLFASQIRLPAVAAR